MSQPGIRQKFFIVLKVYFKPSRKNLDFGFLPLPSKPAWLKNDHLTLYFRFSKISVIRGLPVLEPFMLCVHINFS